MERHVTSPAAVWFNFKQQFQAAISSSQTAVDICSA
jgi:hypothetical protein